MNTINSGRFIMPAPRLLHVCAWLHLFRFLFHIFRNIFFYITEPSSATLRATFLSASGNRLSWENHKNVATNDVPDTNDIGTGIPQE